MNLFLVAYTIHTKMKASDWLSIFSVGFFRYKKIPGLRKFIILNLKMEILEAAEAEVPELINRDETKKSKILINSHAGGMAVARPYGFEIDFVENPIIGSAA